MVQKTQFAEKGNVEYVIFYIHNFSKNYYYVSQAAMNLMNDRLEKQEARKEELRQIIETLLKSDQWKYIMATSGTGFDFSENNPTMQEVNP